MVSISITPLTDLVTIAWKPSISPGVTGYIIYEYHYNLGNWSYDSIRSENSTALQSIFSYPKVRTQPVKFYVAAYYDLSHRSPPENTFQQAIFTTCRYDSCNMTVRVSWTKYIGWGSEFDYYQVFQINNGFNIQIKADSISYNDTVLTIPVDPNKNYSYYVCAKNKSGITSLSNDSSLFTNSANAPAYIRANTASFDPNSNKPVHLEFAIDPNSPIKKYQLFVSDNADSAFVPLNDPVTANSATIDIQDNTIGSSPRYYRLDALNFCGKSATQSNIATAIISKLTAQSNEVHLVWNDYKGWYQGVNQYNIYRIIGNEAPQNIGNTGTNYFTDNVSTLVGQKYSGNICYYIEAVSKQDSVGNVFHSLSSSNCIDLSESVFVPEGFTPNGDGHNDEFKPSFAFLPQEYTIIIYNRYGFKVFELTQQLTGVDDTKGWDGTIGSGQRAPEGTYIYFIKFSSQTGKTIEKKGNFSLIYP